MYLVMKMGSKVLKLFCAIEGREGKEHYELLPGWKKRIHNVRQKICQLKQRS